MRKGTSYLGSGSYSPSRASVSMSFLLGREEEWERGESFIHPSLLWRIGVSDSAVVWVRTSQTILRE